MLLKRQEEANTCLNLDFGEYYSTVSSENDKNGTPLIIGTDS